MKNGDLIQIDTIKNEIIWKEKSVIDKIQVTPPPKKIETSNYLKKYIKLVSGAEEGCITFK